MACVTCCLGNDSHDEAKQNNNYLTATRFEKKFFFVRRTIELSSLSGFQVCNM